MAGSRWGRLVVASNRGPVSFVRDERGRLIPRTGAGGLVTALAGALQGTGGLWVAAAMSQEDREGAARGPVRVGRETGGYRVRYLAFDARDYERFYNGISNSVLWFVHHTLWDVPREPRFDARTREAWEAYRRVNRAFAEALAREGRREGGPTAYLVQDYHLSLVPAMLRQRAPAGGIAHFSHIPFAGPDYLAVLPAWMREELLRGLLGADLVGFHTARWAERFLRCCRELGAGVDLARRVVRWEGREVRVGVYPISVDAPGLRDLAGSEAVARARRRLLRWKGEARLLLRVDRAELSKNILRGFLAYETLLATRPRWRRRVRFLALLNPSREGVPGYAPYVRECLERVDRINRRFGTPDWAPVRVVLRDDRTASVAALGLYDVLLVNPVFDGMNLVAKEGPVLNERDGVLVLSENAGAHAELQGHALVVNPFDLGATADALEAALEMGPEERRRRARGLREAVLANTLDRWVEDQLRDLVAAAGA